MTHHRVVVRPLSFLDSETKPESLVVLLPLFFGSPATSDDPAQRVEGCEDGEWGGKSKYASGGSV